MSLRSWGASFTREGRFSPVGVAFHWVMAALILFQLGLGWSLKLMPAGGDKVASYALHGAVGLVIFLLAFFRVTWRIMVPDPYNSADRQGWRTTFAHIVEHLFYVCFFMLPLSGWAMWSALTPPGDIDLLIGWPPMPFHELEEWLRRDILAMANDIHLAFVWLLLIMVPLHVAAALKHHFWDRNDVLQGILPQVPDAPRPRGAAKRKRKSPRSPQA